MLVESNAQVWKTCYRPQHVHRNLGQTQTVDLSSLPDALNTTSVMAADVTRLRSIPLSIAILTKAPLSHHLQGYSSTLRGFYLFTDAIDGSHR